MKLNKQIFEYLNLYKKDLKLECQPKLKKYKNQYELVGMMENSNYDKMNINFYQTQYDFYNSCYDSVHNQIKKYIKKQEYDRFR